MLNETRYAPEIDGLRAIAILSVVVFHAMPEALPGGFLGVDIFFVISGYLIGHQILSRLAASSFSFVDFYKRRIRRLLPSLFVVYIATVVAGAFLLAPSAFSALTLSMRASVLMASNFHFASRTGYFDDNASVSPLLHTWSLSIEEQFYLVIPALLWAISIKRFHWIGPTLIVLTLASMIAALHGMTQDPGKAFFLPQTRAWELFCGVLIARYAPLKGLSSRGLASLAILALAIMTAAIVTPVKTASAEVLIAAFGACVAAATIIETSRHGATPVSAALSHKALVYIGGVSYPLYLWHWPLLVFVRQFSEGDALPYWIVGACLTAFVLAVATRRYVETPFRFHRKLTTKAVYVCLACALGVLIGISLVSEATKGLPQRFSPQLRAVFASLDEWRTSPRLTCMRMAPSVDFESRRKAGAPCQMGVADKALDMVLWGDSHAASFQPGFDQWLRKRGQSGIAITSECTPVTIREPGRKPIADCATVRQQILEAFLQSQAPVLTLALRWNRIVEGRMPSERGHKALSQSERMSRAAFLEGELRDIAEKVSRHGKHLVIIYSVPEITFHVPDKVGSRLSLGLSPPEGPLRAHILADRQMTKDAIDRAAAGLNVSLIDPIAHFCTDRCAVVSQQAPLYFDNHHISIQARDIVVDMLDAAAGALAPVAR